MAGQSVSPSVRQPAQTGLCLPVVPAGICGGVGLRWTLQGGAGVLGRLLGRRRARVQQWCRFIRVEGPAVRVRAGGASSWPMLWNPPEVLQWSFPPRMVVGIKVVPSSFVVRMPETSSRTMKRRIGATQKQVFWSRGLTGRSTACDPGGPGRCCTRTSVSGGRCCCGNHPSCGTCLRVSAGRSGPCSGAARTGGAGPPARTGGCCLDTCIYAPSASPPSLSSDTHKQILRLCNRDDFYVK